MTIGSWKSLSEEEIEGRYVKNSKEERKGEDILYSSGNLKGIFAHLRQQSKIDNEVNVTVSSGQTGDKKLLLDIENTSNDFYTGNLPNSWICFEFKHHPVIPTNYTITSYGCPYHPRSWVIEGSVTGSEWFQLDEERGCSSLKGQNLVHTFGNKNERKKEFKYIRMKSTGPDWFGDNFLEIRSIEFYGKIIK